MKYKIAQTILWVAGMVAGYYLLIGATCWDWECLSQPWHPYLAVAAICVAIVVWALETIFNKQK